VVTAAGEGTVPAKQRISAVAKAWISRRGRVATRVAKECHRFLRKFDNHDFRIETNGEHWLMTRMADARVVFDVGANVGKWALLCAVACPRAEIHAFEILPSTCDELIANVGGHARIKINRFGLADTSGSIIVTAKKSHSDLTSLVGDVRLMHEDLQFEEHAVSVCSGDSYCAEHAIDKIDFLKIDTEGAELAVLSGFKRLIESRMIDVIQFEYGLPNILARTLVRDFYDLLSPFGYRIGKLYPGRVDFRDWRPRDEEWPGPNYVAALIDV
jgi:FkbM family methyltransferase